MAPDAGPPATEEGAAEGAAGGSTWSGPNSRLEESCRRELAAAEALLPTVALPTDAAAAPSEPQLVEPSPRGPPTAAATWRYLSSLRPAKLCMRAVLPGTKTAARCASSQLR